MDEELFETMVRCAGEMMQHTRSRLREENPILQEYQEDCSELDLKFEEALQGLKEVNPEMAHMFEAHHEAYESLGYQTELFSYIQGYIDCMQLLSGMGVVSGVNQEQIGKYLAEYKFKREM